MKQLLIALAIVCSFSAANAQTIEELYNNRNLEALVEYADKTDTLTGEQVYCIGFAFFQLENDAKALEMYDLAIAKGLDDDYIYLYKGLSLVFTDQLLEARKNFRIAVARNPEGQKNMTELANTFSYEEAYDSAIYYFEKARALPFEFGMPYVNLPQVYYGLGNNEKALEEFRKSAEMIEKQAPEYIELLTSIGQLEYMEFNRYDKAIEAYSKVTTLIPDDYDNYPRLMTAYYANQQPDQGDSIFSILKTAYEASLLSERYQKYARVPVAEFDWNGQTVVIYKKFEAPKKTLDIIFQIYLLSKDGESVERTLMTEQTYQIDDGAKHLLCERGQDGSHFTYPYGWNSDDIKIESLKEAVVAVLDKKLTPAAATRYGVDGPSSDSGKKKKKKKRKKKN